MTVRLVILSMPRSLQRPAESRCRGTIFQEPLPAILVERETTKGP